MNRGRLMIALVIAVISILSYLSKSQPNEITGETQHIGDITAEQEIALGLQAAPQMAAQHGGEDPDPRAHDIVERVGHALVQRTAAGRSPYQFQFHLLSDPQTINAFALPGGQVFITRALLSRLKTEGELAGVLGHEIGHVVARHGAEHMAKQQLTQGLTGAAVLATYDPNSPGSQRNAAVVAMIGQMVNMKFGREDELESDRLGVRFMTESGWDPRAMIGVMKTLEEASSGGRQPEFFSTHPNPENRIARIESAIQAQFPNGLPNGLKP